MSILASAAVALFGNTRRSSAARACKANVAAIASAQSGRSLRVQSYATMATLVTGPEGLIGPPTCPLDGAAYQVVQTGTSTAIADGYVGAIDIRCPNRTTHSAAANPAWPVANWVMTMPAVPVNSLP
jgi:hypothetical protein